MRKKRSFKVNRCYHLTSRIAHRAYFFDEGEKDRFVNLIRRVEQFCGVRVLGYAVMSNHFHIYVYLEDEHPVSEEELYAKICRLYCKDTLAAIIDKWERLKELAAQADVSIRHAGLTEFDDYKRSFVARMFNITSFMMTLKEHYTLSYNARHKHCGTLWEGRYRSRESKPVSSDMSPILAYIDCNPAEADICRDPAKYKWCSFAAACEGDELARRAYRFAYGNDEDPWKTIAELHRAAIRKRLGEIGEERRTGNVVSVIAALFSKREEEYAAAKKVRAVGAQIPDALPVKLERGDNRVAMSVLAALKDGAKKPAQLRTSLGIRSAPFFTLTYLKPLAANGLIEMTDPTSPNSPQQSYRLTSKGYAAVA